MLLNSRTLEITIRFPSQYNDRDIEKFKRELSNYKVRNRGEWIPRLGNFTLAYSVKKLPDKAKQVTISAIQDRGKQYNDIMVEKA